jgi:hypothetical protein
MRSKLRLCKQLLVLRRRKRPHPDLLPARAASGEKERKATLMTKDADCSAPARFLLPGMRT